MKTILLQIIVATTCLGYALAGEIPKPVDQQVQAVLNRLHDDELTWNGELMMGKYGVDDLLQDLKQIEVTDDLLGKMRMSATVDPLKIEMLEMALAVRSPKVSKMINELGGWYGYYTHELPEELFHTKWESFMEGQGSTVAEQRKFMQMLAGFARVHDVEPLRKEHTDPAYLPAWKFWFMAPPSKQRKIMNRRIGEAIYKIADESVIPLYLEKMKIVVGQVDAKSKSGVVAGYARCIANFPSETAFETLLYINRYAVSNDLNGEDYYESVSRRIIRLLASRLAFADSLIDPKMKVVIESKGYKEKPEEVPLAGELWKKYKPLLEARLAAKTDETPQADIELIKSALLIMPKR